MIARGEKGAYITLQTSPKGGFNTKDTRAAKAHLQGIWGKWNYLFNKSFSSKKTADDPVQLLC